MLIKNHFRSLHMLWATHLNIWTIDLSINQASLDNSRWCVVHNMLSKSPSYRFYVFDDGSTQKKSPQHKCCAYAGVGIHRKYSPIASNKCSLRGPGGIQCYLCLLLVWVTYWVLFCCLSSMFHCLCLLLVGLVRRAARVRRALAPVILAPRCTGGEGIEGGSSCNQPHQPPPPVKIIKMGSTLTSALNTNWKV